MQKKSKPGGHGSRRGTKLEDLPPFVYLSCVLQQYGHFGKLAQSAADDSDAGTAEPAVMFGSFLAELVKSAKVLLFDVHSLKLVTGDELEDVVEYLLHYTNDSRHPLNVGIAAGLDYCMDAHRLAKEIQGTGTLRRLEYRSPIGSTERPSKTQPVTPIVSVYSSDVDVEWEVPKVPLTTEFIALQLAIGREQAARERASPPRVFPKPRKPAALQPRDRSEYRGATEPNDWSCIWGSDQIYLVGKFNIAGDPALLLENDLPKKVGPRGHAAGSRLALRFEAWQARINAMYYSGPHKGKPHRTLSEELAKQLNAEMLPSSKKTISAEMIRRETFNPSSPEAGVQKPQ